MSNLTSYADVKTCLTCPNTKDLMNLYTADILNKLQLFIYIEQPHLTKLPKFICQSCENSLNTAYAFKEQCEDRTTNLLNIIKNNKAKLSTENCSEPQINISMIKNEDLNPLELNIENIDIKEEYLEPIIEAEVKIEEIKVQKTEKHKNTPNKALKYPCTYCDEKFRYKSEFFVHRKSHKTCPECNKVFDTDKHMLQHLRYNHTNRKSTEPCNICGKEFSKQNLGRHIRSFHNKELLHFCEICNKGFYQSATLKTHMAVHSSESQLGISDETQSFKCEECEQVFKLQRYLDLHKKVHSDDKTRKVNEQIPCKYCDQVFCSERDYDIHLQQHKEHKESFQCIVCNRKFALESRYTLHKKIHLVVFKVCDICGKSLPSSASFSSHMRIHANETPFKCSVCPKQYKHRTQLNVHRRCHNGERPYKCKLCSKAFRQRNHLDSHQAVHSTEKKFSCDICGVSVGYKQNLTVHMQKVHQKEKN